MLVKAGKIIGSLLASAAAAIVIWEAATNETEADADDIVESIRHLTSVVSNSAQIEFSPSELKDAGEALNDLSRIVVDRGQGDTSGGLYLNVLDGSFALKPGEAADVETPDGTFATVGYVSRNSPGSSIIIASFNGERHRINPGHVFDVSESCVVTYMTSPGPAASEAATFRFRCRN